MIVQWAHRALAACEEGFAASGGLGARTWSRGVIRVFDLDRNKPDYRLVFCALRVGEAPFDCVPGCSGLFALAPDAISILEHDGNPSSLTKFFHAQAHPAWIRALPTDRPSGAPAAMKILLVEDDAALRDTLYRLLRRSKHDVHPLGSGALADAALAGGTFDLVVLDLGLPYLDGIEVLRRLRARGDVTPVLVLTARDAVDHRVAGLDLGADDYLTKPVALPEFEARVRALLRRAGLGSAVLRVGALVLDPESRRASVSDNAVDISAREATILEALMQRPGQVVIKGRLAVRLSATESEVGQNAVEVYIHRLRRKLEPHGIAIRTIHGLGYMLEPPQDEG